jgi:hypothetical protein
MPLPAVTLPLAARIRQYRWGALIAALGLATVVFLVWQSWDPPAAAPAAMEPDADSACYPGHPSGSERMYLKAGVESTEIPDRDNRPGAVTVTAIATGTAHDCGPAGRPRQAPDITVALEFRLEGERLCHPETVSKGETCSSDRRELTVTHKYSCKKEQVCDVSVSNTTFRPNVDGRISTLETRSIVTNGSDIIPAIRSHRMVVSG